MDDTSTWPADFVVPAEGFRSLFPFEVVERTDSSVELSFAILPVHRNTIGVVHGGVLMTLMDIACGMVRPAGNGTWVTIQLSTNFMLPAGEGPLTIRATRRGGGRKIFTAVVEIADGNGNVCAVGQGSFRRIDG